MSVEVGHTGWEVWISRLVAGSAQTGKGTWMWFLESCQISHRNGKGGEQHFVFNLDAVLWVTSCRGTGRGAKFTWRIQEVLSGEVDTQDEEFRCDFLVMFSTRME